MISRLFTLAELWGPKENKEEELLLYLHQKWLELPTEVCENARARESESKRVSSLNPSDWHRPRSFVEDMWMQEDWKQQILIACMQESSDMTYSVMWLAHGAREDLWFVGLHSHGEGYKTAKHYISRVDRCWAQGARSTQYPICWEH